MSDPLEKLFESLMSGKLDDGTLTLLLEAERLKHAPLANDHMGGELAGC